MSLFADRLGPKLNLFLLGFVLLLGLTTAGLIIYGFQRTQDDATNSSREGLEQEGKQTLSGLTSAYSENGQAQLETTAGFAQQAARYMLDVNALRDPAPFDPATLTPAADGSIADVSSTRRTDLFVPEGTAIDEAVIRDIQDSSVLDDLFPTLIQGFAGRTRSPNFEAVAIYFQSVNNVTRMYPPFADIDANETTLAPPDLQAVTRAVGPDENPARSTYWSAPYEDTAGRGYVITALTPVYEGDEYRGVMGVDLSIDRLIAQIDQIHPTANGFAFYMDRDGVLLPTSRADEVQAEIGDPNNDGLADVIAGMRSGRAAVETVEIDNEEVFIAYTPLTGVGGTFALAAPVDEVTEQAALVEDAIDEGGRNTLLFTLLAIGAILGIGLAAAAWFSRRLILQPIAEVVDGTRSIAAGNLETRIPVRSADELGTLADSFNTMSGVLGERTEALRASEAEMRALFQAMPDLVVRLDREGRYLNIASTRESGELSQAQAVVGKTVYDTYPREQADRMMEPVFQALDTGETQSIEYSSPYTTGERWFNASISRMSNDEVIVVSRDITERREQEKELREREEQYRSTFESTSDGLIITRIADGQIVEVNPAMAEMHGYTRDEMMHMHPTQFIHPDDHHLFASYIETVAGGGEYRCRARDIRKDGTQFHVEVLGTPVSYSGARHILGVVRDMTASVEAERILEERVEDRTRELSALLHTSEAVASTLDIKLVAKAILDELAPVAGYTGATLLMVEGDDLVIIDSYGPFREEVVSGPTARFPRRVIPRDFWASMEQGEAVSIEDVRGNSGLARSYRDVFEPFLDSPSFKGICSWVAVPLSSKGTMVGMLTASHDEPGHFTAERTSLIAAAGSQAAVAMDNARLFEQTEERTRELASLLDVSRTIASKLTFNELVETIISQACALFETTAISVNLVDQRGIATHLGSNNPLFEQLGITRGFRYSMRPYGDIFTTVKRNEAVLIDDIRGDSPLALDYRNAVGGEIDRAFAMVRSWMAVPMTAKGNLIGLIFVAHDQPGTYTERDLALAQAVANQAAIAIDNARLFEETEERTRELQTLLDVSTNVASTIDLQTLVDVIVEQVGVVADYDRASVLVLEDDASALRVMTLRRKGDAAPVGAPPDTKFPVAEAPLMWGEFNAGRAVVIDDVRDESDPLAGDYRASAAPRTDPMLEATRSWMGVPLISKERVIGIIALTSARVGAYTQRHGQLVSSIATQAAAAMENARLFSETEERTRELQTLLTVSTDVASTIELEPLMQLILEQLSTVADYDRASMLVLEEPSMLRLLAVLDREGSGLREIPAGVMFSLEDGFALWRELSAGRSVLIDDVTADTEMAASFRESVAPQVDPELKLIRSWMAVPIALKDRVIGIFALSSAQVSTYTQRHAGLATAIGAQAAVAIENARLFEQAEERTTELSTLLDVSRNVASTIELQPLLDLILEQVRYVAPYDGGTFFILRGDKLRAESFATKPDESMDLTTIGLEIPTEGLLLWELARKGAPIIIEDIHDESAEAQAYRAAAGPLLHTRFRRVKSWLGVPISLKDRPLGLMALSGHTTGVFTEQHARLARAVADQAAVAIENASLYAETEQQNRESAALLEISRSLTSTLELQSLVRVILEQLGTVVDYTGSSVVIINRDNDLEILASRVLDPPDTPSSSGIRFPLRKDSELWRQLDGGETVVIDDIHDDSVVAREYRDTIGDAIHDSFRKIESWMAVPLAIKDRVIGLLTMSRSQAGYFTADHAHIASAVGQQAAVAIENARLYQEAESRTRELAALLDVSKDIASTLDRGALARGILGQLRSIVDYNGASIIVKDGEYLAVLEYDRDQDRMDMEAEAPSRFPLSAVGPLWSVMLRGQELVTRDIRENPRDEQNFRVATGDQMDTTFSYVRSLLSVPLVVQDRVIGLVMMSHEQPGHFTRDHARVVRSVADQAALALENARLFEEARQRTRETEALLRADAELYRSLSLDDVFQALCDVAVEVLGVGKTMVTTIDDDEGRYTIRASRNIAQSSLDRMMEIRRSTPRKALALMREPLVNADARGEMPEMVPVFEAEDIVSTIDIPIRIDGIVRGDFSIAHTHAHAPAPDELRLYQAMADRASVAIQNAELYERAQQVASLEERQRLARELHDSVSQALYGIALGARTARTQLDRDPAAAVDPMEYVLQLAEAGLAEMRALIFELRPESLQTEGLVAAIEKQVASTRSRYGLEVQADLGSEPQTKIEVKEALYRVAQEALHNIVKHAHAQHVVVSLVTSNGTIDLRVRDDGRGFDTEGSYPGHVGLHSMRERIDKLRGTITIESVSGRGTSVNVQVPVEGA